MRIFDSIRRSVDTTLIVVSRALAQQTADVVPRPAGRRRPWIFFTARYLSRVPLS